MRIIKRMFDLEAGTMIIGDDTYILTSEYNENNNWYEADVIEQDGDTEWVSEHIVVTPSDLIGKEII